MENFSYTLLSTETVEAYLIANFNTGQCYFKIIKPNDPEFPSCQGNDLKAMLPECKFSSEEYDWLYDYFFGDATSPQRDEFSEF